MASVVLLGCGIFLFQHGVLKTMLLGDEFAFGISVYERAKESKGDAEP
ncbi:MAG: hypothetical protein ACE3JK_10615 [Sporolactobacillus sp.]